MFSKIAAIQRGIAWIVARIEEGFGAICILAVSLLVFIEIIYREGGAPTVWMEEAARYVFIAFAFMMAALVARRREHLVVEVLPLIIRKKLTTDIINLCMQIICLILTVLFAYLSYDYMVYSWSIPGYGPGTGIHLGWPKSFPFIAAVLLAGYYLAIVIKDAAKLKGKAPTDKEA